LDEIVELTDDFLDEFFEPFGILSLVEVIMMFSSMLRVGHRFECIKLIVVEKKCVFTKFLIDTIMQDGSTRERSNNSTSLSKSKIIKIKIKEKEKKIKSSLLITTLIYNTCHNIVI